MIYVTRSPGLLLGAAVGENEGGERGSPGGETEAEERRHARREAGVGIVDDPPKLELDRDGGGLLDLRDLGMARCAGGRRE